MARIVFEVDLEATPEQIVEALDTEKGIAAWWTADTEFAGGAGSVMKLGFPIAPVPFELRVDEVSPARVTWTSVGEFPPHWVGTTVRWSLGPAQSGSGTTVHFDHDGWANDEGPFPSSAFVWGQLMGTLKRHVETGDEVPMFAK